MRAFIQQNNYGHWVAAVINDAGDTIDHCPGMATLEDAEAWLTRQHPDVANIVRDGQTAGAAAAPPPMPAPGGQFAEPPRGPILVTEDDNAMAYGG